jgi:hypothetical protein
VRISNGLSVPIVFATAMEKYFTSRSTPYESPYFLLLQ